jgi:asparagine synthase (glutamine-hydrolysing)
LPSAFDQQRAAERFPYLKKARTIEVCGICGRFNFLREAPVERPELEAMARAMRHRGPDDEGYYCDGPLGLGFRRLSIIDLEGGHQPMSDQENTTWVVFNGEIYNFQALRKELEGLGYVFRTRCDTEVIVHGYKQWGDEVLNRLNGMFGLAIWDVRKRRLLIARDPFGIKLVYYRIHAGSLWFGSEMRPVCATMRNETIEADPEALALFLQYRYTPSPHTAVRGVRKLAPGTKLVVKDGVVEESRWYRFSPVPFVPLKSVEEAGEELLALYRQAVRRQLVSDVPVGLLLSGGIDSALLLALMNENGAKWRTYSVGYGESYADDELADAKETAGILKSRHTGVKITREVFEQELGDIVASLEEPVATSSIVPMYFVCQRAREDVKVGLVGQGPDELFGGYRRHLGARYATRWAALPVWARVPLQRTIAALPRNETLKRGLYALDGGSSQQGIERILSLLPGRQIQGLFWDGLLKMDSGEKLLQCWSDMADLAPRSDQLGRLQFMEVRSTLPDELLMYADKLSMAHSLELRVPYLDKDIVEYAERLAANLKVRNGVGKWLHRQVCRQFLPQAIVRRPKRGFAMSVVDSWFRDALGGTMADTFADEDSAIYQFLKPAAVRQLYAEHVAGRQDNHKVLFSLIVLEKWLGGVSVGAAATV